MMSALKKIWEIISRPRVRYDPLVKVFIDSDALRSNYKAFAGQFPGLAIAPVLKSNAYGHGLREVASVLDSVHAPFFAVDSFYEALVLRRAGVKTPILIIGYTREDLIRRKTLRNVAFTVADLHVLSELAVSLKRPQRIHLKVDTGMHRQGGMPHEVPIALDCFERNPNLILEGVYSHLSDADNPDPTFTNKQIKVWNEIAEKLWKADSPIRYFHLTATKGFGSSSRIKANVARIGIGLYGIGSIPNYSLPIRPVLSLRSVVASVKPVLGGEKIGYNATFETPQEMRIAMVPLGYNEGVDRRLSNLGTLLLQNKPCRIVGRVSMNITTIDVAGVPEAQVGDEVVVLSDDPNAENSVENVAKICHTTPYEILIHIPGYLHRELK